MKALKIKYVKLPVDTYWISMRKEDPSEIKIKILVILIQFPTSYLYKLEFPLTH